MAVPGGRQHGAADDSSSGRQEEGQPDDDVLQVGTGAWVAAVEAPRWAVLGRRHLGLSKLLLGVALTGQHLTARPGVCPLLYPQSYKGHRNYRTVKVLFESTQQGATHHQLLSPASGACVCQ